MCAGPVVKADRNDWDKQVTIASVQSLRKSRLERVPQDQFELLVHDEAHHFPAMTFQRVFDYFQARFKLGCTATPDRLDGKRLSEWYGEEPLYHYPLKTAIQDGWLVPICQFAIKTYVSLDDVSRRMGDFAENELAAAVDTEERNKVIVDAHQKHACDRRTLVYAVNVEHTQHLAEKFQGAGIKAAYVTGAMALEERRTILRQFARGQIPVLVNCMILTEGFDDPDTSCVIMARPTQSRALYTQAVGRGLRLPKYNEDKKDLLVLDITDNCRRHSLITACSLLGLQRNNAAGANVLEELEREEWDRQCGIKLALGPVSWALQSVCPWSALPTLARYQPKSPWQAQPATDKQLGLLRKFGLRIERALTKGEACSLIDQTIQLNNAMPATAKQAWFLRYHGAWEEGTTKKEAMELISAIKQIEAEANIGIGGHN
jgi:superfamily II DNA or RNA helicase